MKFLDVPQSGSIAGTTHSHNRAGQYTRNRRSPVQPVGTGRRAFIRAAFGGAASAYAGLTGAQQAAWVSYADSHPVTDSLGQSIKLTGQQMFVAINTQHLNVGDTISTIPPTSPAVFAQGPFTFTAVSAGAITVTPAGAGGATDWSLIAFSAPQSSGRLFCKTFWQWKAAAGDDNTAQVATTAYHAQFGIPPVGSRIFCKLTPVSQEAVTGVPVIQYATVT
jgi:hypothetical protein